jgi:hypothetical protein
MQVFYMTSDDEARGCAWWAIDGPFKDLWQS